MQNPRLTNRRQFLRTAALGVTGTAILAACAPAAPTPTAVPAAAPKEAPKPAAPPPAAPSPAPKPKQVELRFAVAYDPTALDFVKKGVTMVEAKFPQLKIKVENTPWADYWQKLTTDVAGGNAPDTILMVTMYAQEWLVKNVLLDLDPYIRAEKFDIEDYWPKMMPAYKDKQGHVYALPYDISVQTFYFSQEIFQKAGLPAPTADMSWDQLRQMAPQLVKREGDRTTQFAYDGFPTGWPLEGFLWQNGGRLLSADRKECLINSPECTEVVQYFTDLRVKDKVAPTPADATGVDLWNSGRLATRYTNSSVVANYRVDTKFAWDVLPLPKRAKAPDVRSCSAGGSYCAAKATKFPDEAWLFVKEFTSKEILGVVVGDSGRTVPGRRSAPTTLFDPTKPPKNARVLIEIAENAQVMELAETPYYTKVTKAYDTMLGEIYTGRKPAKEGLDEVKKQIDPILQGKD
ncbi:MAG: sugar ABC transporter substrate-binding protein [Chloroflexi bacterium]|nr:sugar ABC transporter substrate-binding protein [Chloroflexota bacterium]